MNNFGRRPSLRERIARFMAYRYGIDRLYYVLIVICFALTFINLFLRSFIISSIETILFAFAAGHTFFTFKFMICFWNYMCTHRTHFYTVSAQGAFVFIQCKLRFKVYTFGIVTPHAFKRTAFEKHSCPYSVAVVHGKALYLNYSRFHITPGFLPDG